MTKRLRMHLNARLFSPPPAVVPVPPPVWSPRSSENLYEGGSKVVGAGVEWIVSRPEY